jgi:arylsulfatase A-like enzyme
MDVSMSARSHDIARDSERRARLWVMLTGGALGSVFGGLASIKAMNTWEVHSYLVARQWALLADRVAPYAPPLVLAGLVLGLAAGIGMSRLLPTVRMPAAIRSCIVAVGAIVLCGTAAAFLKASTRHLPHTPNVLLVVIDTARPDHFSLYGYPRETTPNLDRMASSSTLFTRAYSTSSWTVPAHASLFTGLLPGIHGVTQESWKMRLDHVTLAETFWEHGYRTFAAVGNPNVSIKMFFSQGFDEFHQTWLDEGATDSASHPAVRHFEALLNAPSQRPFFAFINLMEPHSPYVDGPHFDQFETQPELDVDRNDLQDFFMGRVQFGEDELARLRDRYDSEILFADEIVGQLIDELERRGLLDDTVLVVTSDHGEHFGEHDLVDHVFNIYEGNVRIPLMIRYPRILAPGKVNDAPIQLHDIFPTLLSLTGNAEVIDSMRIQGQDASDPDSLDAMRPLILSYGYPLQVLQSFGEDHDAPRLAPYRRRLWGMREGNMKIILGDDGSVEVYDLGADPRELRDLTKEEPHRELVAKLEARMRSLVAIEVRDAPIMPEMEAGADFDEATKRQLRSLGYLAPESD